MQLESLEARRLFAALTKDLSFGADGGVGIDNINYLGDAGGRIYVLSNEGRDIAEDDSYQDVRAVAVRYGSDGSAETVVGPTEYFDSSTASGTLDANGRLVFATPLKQTVSMSRYTPSNKRDRTFTATFTPPGLSASVRVTTTKVVSAPDGSTFVQIVLKSGPSGQVEQAWIAKADADGVAVATFGIDGLIDLGSAVRGTPTTLLGVDGSGRVYVTRDDTILRFRAGGMRDRTFASQGVLRPTGGPKAAALDADGRLLVVTTDSSGTTLTRYDATGQPDADFDSGGTIRIAADSAPAVKAMLPQTDGTVVLQLDRRILQIDSAGIVFRYDTGTPDTVVIARQADGRYLAKSDYFIERLATPTRVAVNGYGTAYIRTGNDADTVRVARVGPKDRTVYPQTLRITIGDKSFKVRNVHKLDVKLGGGDDVYTSNASVDWTLVSGDGDDTIQGGVGADNINPGGGANTIDVGGGFSTDRIINRQRLPGRRLRLWQRRRRAGRPADHHRPPRCEPRPPAAGVFVQRGDGRHQLHGCEHQYLHQERRR